MGPWEYFRPAPVSFQHTLILSICLISGTIRHASFVFVSVLFFVSDVDSAISPSDLCSFYWKMAFRNESLEPGVFPAT